MLVVFLQEEPEVTNDVSKVFKMWVVGDNQRGFAIPVSGLSQGWQIGVRSKPSPINLSGQSSGTVLQESLLQISTVCIPVNRTRADLAEVQSLAADNNGSSSAPRGGMKVTMVVSMPPTQCGGDAAGVNPHCSVQEMNLLGGTPQSQFDGEVQAAKVLVKSLYRLSHFPSMLPSW